MHSMPICCGTEVALGCPCAVAFWRKAFCMHFVPMCLHDQVRLDQAFADAHRRKAFCVYAVPICRGKRIKPRQACADDPPRRRKASSIMKNILFSFFFSCAARFVTISSYRGNETLCVLFVLICLHDQVKLDQAFADALWRKALCVHQVFFCLCSKWKFDEACAADAQHWRKKALCMYAVFICSGTEVESG
jgi:hypothetical protein